MSASPYKTLLQALSASSYLTGTTLAFGEESIADQGSSLPYVVMVPRGGPAQDPGYARDGSTTTPADLDAYTEDLWEFGETFDFYIWALSTSPGAVGVDHAESARAVRLALLQALRDQRAQADANGTIYHGLSFKVIRSDWETMQNAVSRLGRALILTVRVDIPEVPATPPEATIETTQQNLTVVHAPS